MEEDGALDVAERLFAAIMAGDVEAVAALYAPDVAIWHNSDGREQDKEENLRVLRWVTRNVEELRYEEIRREATASGFVQQHVLRGKAANGSAVEIPACIVGTVRDGLITRIDEYLDSAQTEVLRR